MMMEKSRLSSASSLIKKKMNKLAIKHSKKREKITGLNYIFADLYISASNNPMDIIHRYQVTINWDDNYSQ